MTLKPYIRKPRAVSTSYDARQVAAAYNYPLQFTGKGYTCGIIELGGGFTQADVTAYFDGLGLPVPTVVPVGVDGGKSAPDGPDGADGEVLLDIEVAASIAPGAHYRVYFAPNSDRGFLDAIKQAIADKVTVISISWGGPESSWGASVLDQYDAVFSQARKAGIVVLAASGDTGSADGTSGNAVDFPASSPNVIGCGGTRLTLDAGKRATEVTWDDNDRTSATGGGVSAHFPGRQVPDVAGNADPQTGYNVLVDGQEYVIGGTSAVAPLYAGLVLLLSEAIGKPLGAATDLSNLLLTNLGVCFDVTSGDNGAYRAGPGRDNVTGLGVVDGGKLLAVLQDSVADPAPVPGPAPTPAPVYDDADAAADLAYAAAARKWLASKPFFYKSVQTATQTWLAKRDL